MRTATWLILIFFVSAGTAGVVFWLAVRMLNAAFHDEMDELAGEREMRQRAVLSDMLKRGPDGFAPTQCPWCGEKNETRLKLCPACEEQAIQFKSRAGKGA